ncbi:hypothetical protein HPB48_014760 [Haemaphysalis longicornis]|uniref:Uncharacterized protein n=1 Tax=Haemaphysalis longicornis TaxID=44386 RepID=A0A9J6FYT5_HAELO|nr:hypothetical protein HPB48_014760 [Haemaphysalis longicornis]
MRLSVVIRMARKALEDEDGLKRTSQRTPRSLASPPVLRPVVGWAEPRLPVAVDRTARHHAPSFTTVYSHGRTPNIQLYVGAHPISRVAWLRVLGLRILENGSDTETIRALQSSTQQIARLISRIPNLYHGIKEVNLLRLVQAVIISRITYVNSFLNLKKLRETS